MDKASYEQLYMELLPGMYRLAQGILHHPADAQDAVQQAALNVWRHIDRLKDDRARAYIARAVINEARNIQRERMRQYPVERIDHRAQSTAPDPSLREAMDALPENLRLPLLLKYMEGYSEKETAKILHITLPSLKARLYRARRRLERELREEVVLL